MDKAAFATIEPSWWLVDAGAHADIEALRKELEPTLGSDWHQSKDKLEAFYDLLGSLTGDELDAATEADKQTAWLQKAAAAAKPKQSVPAPDASQAPAGTPAGPSAAGEHDGAAHGDAAVPEAPPLTEDEIKDIATTAGVDPEDLKGIDLTEVEGEDVEAEDEDEAEAEAE